MRENKDFDEAADRMTIVLPMVCVMFSICAYFTENKMSAVCLFYAGMLAMSAVVANIVCAIRKLGVTLSLVSACVWFADGCILFFLASSR